MPASPEGGTTGSMEFGPEVKSMNDILRFLQLLCENHNSALQVCPSYTERVCFVVYKQWCTELVFASKVFTVKSVNQDT